MPATKTIDPDRGYLDAAEDSAAQTGDVARNRYLARTLQISSILQTTLDVQQIIGLFAREVQVTVPYASMTYTHPLHSIKLVVGEPDTHSCGYRLVVGGTTVGQLTFTRATPFAQREMQELEYLLCAVVYPLLNAFKYKQALDSATKDPLTGLSNRAVMDEAMKREIQLARRHGSALSLIIVDVDDFKAINDRFGHIVGDQVIRCVADGIAGCVRDTDVLSRYGGEEFTILLSSTDQPGACQLAERIRQRVEQLQCEADKQDIAVSVSVGVACLRPNEDEQQLFKRADLAMYAAKIDGKNRVCLAETEAE
jgi:diguanylate cyclase (GGDEF)-like protein